MKLLWTLECEQFFDPDKPCLPVIDYGGYMYSGECSDGITPLTQIVSSKVFYMRDKDDYIKYKELL